MNEPTFADLSVGGASARAAGITLTPKQPAAPAVNAEALERVAGVEYYKVKDDVTMSVLQLQELRKTIQAFSNGAGGSIGQCGSIAKPAIDILDLLLDQVGLRFEHNTFMRNYQTLDRTHGIIVPKGHKWNPKLEAPELIK